MSDLIKREDAIKAIWGDDINPSEDGMVFEAQSHIDRDIKLIPSADRPSAIDLSSVYSTAYKSGYKKGKADRPQEWIPCSERLPANDDWVIISILDEIGDTPYRYSDFGWYFERAKCWIVESEQRTDVVAWMPLPKPYGERESE